MIATEQNLAKFQISAWEQIRSGIAFVICGFRRAWWDLLCGVGISREKEKRNMVKTKYSAFLHIFTFILPSVYRIVDVLDAEDEMLSPVFVCELFL